MDFASAWARLTSWGFFEPGGAADKKKSPTKEAGGGEKKDAVPGNETAAARKPTPTVDAKGGDSEAAISKGAGENELKQAISDQAAKQKRGPSEAVVDARAAFEKAKAWTMDLCPQGDDYSREQVYPKLLADHAEAQKSGTPGSRRVSQRPPKASRRKTRAPSMRTSHLIGSARIGFVAATSSRPRSSRSCMAQRRASVLSRPKPRRPRSRAKPTRSRGGRPSTEV